MNSAFKQGSTKTLINLSKKNLNIVATNVLPKKYVTLLTK